ncbi:MAG: hypothetical protein ACJAQ4_001583 [Cryomorphaceae bacterium]|jgi:hypothetical protein
MHSVLNLKAGSVLLLTIRSHGSALSNDSILK